MFLNFITYVSPKDWQSGIYTKENKYYSFGWYETGGKSMSKSRKKITYIAVLSLSFVLSANPLYAEQAKTGIVTASSLNLRESQSTSSKVLDQIEKGTKVTVIDTSGNWYKVQYNNKTGWLFKDYVSVTENKSVQKSESTASTNSAQNQDKTGTVKASMLNVRKAPNTSAQVVGQLTNGFKVTIIESSGEWYKVKYNNLTGWVSGSYVAVAKQGSSENVVKASVPTQSILQGNTTSSSVDSSKTEAPAKEPEDKTLVTDKTLTQTAKTTDDKTLAATSAPKESGIVNASVLNVREGAGTQYKQIGQLSQGQRVEIKSRKDGWCQIVAANGTSGWVHGDYVSVSNTIASRSDELVDKTLVVPEDADKQKDLRAEIVQYAKKFLGVKYVYGGTSPSGFDCSGFVYYVFSHFNKKLERVAADQAKQGKKVSKSELKPGDLVFFDTNGKHDYINHSGIYIGDGKFIHASSGSSNRKVVISDLTSGFYNESYMTARRVID